MDSLDSLTLSHLQRRTLREATEMYEQNVDLAADFLMSRGIDQAAATSSRLGVVTEPACPEHERLTGMLAIPYVTPAGPVAIKFRALDPERKPKYDAPSGQTVRLYNVMALHQHTDVIAICEGELDALVCTHAVGVPAVGIPGASNWQDHWSRVFSDIERILIVADNDEKEGGANPGRKHAERVAAKLGKHARVVMPPPGYDLTDVVTDYGVEEARDLLGV